jgi:hypothetical protein
LYEIKGNLSLI